MNKKIKKLNIKTSFQNFIKQIKYKLIRTKKNIFHKFKFKKLSLPTKQTITTPAVSKKLTKNLNNVLPTKLNDGFTAAFSTTKKLQKSTAYSIKHSVDFIWTGEVKIRSAFLLLLSTLIIGGLALGLGFGLGPKPRPFFRNPFPLGPIPQQFPQGSLGPPNYIPNPNSTRQTITIGNNIVSGLDTGKLSPLAFSPFYVGVYLHYYMRLTDAQQLNINSSYYSEYDDGDSKFAIFTQPYAVSYDAQNRFRYQSSLVVRGNYNTYPGTDPVTKSISQVYKFQESQPPIPPNTPGKPPNIPPASYIPGGTALQVIIWNDDPSVAAANDHPPLDNRGYYYRDLATMHDQWPNNSFQNTYFFTDGTLNSPDHVNPRFAYDTIQSLTLYQTWLYTSSGGVGPTYTQTQTRMPEFQIFINSNFLYAFGRPSGDPKTDIIP